MILNDIIIYCMKLYHIISYNFFASLRPICCMLSHHIAPNCPNMPQPHAGLPHCFQCFQVHPQHWQELEHQGWQPLPPGDNLTNFENWFIHVVLTKSSKKTLELHDQTWKNNTILYNTIIHRHILSNVIQHHSTSFNNTMQVQNVS